MTDELEPTITINGLALFRKPATEAERMRMAIYIHMIEAKEVPDERCATCAFRMDTPANRSSLVVRIIEDKLHTWTEDDTFRCHMSATAGCNPADECKGFAVIKNDFLRLPT